MDPETIEILKKEFQRGGELTIGEAIKYAKILIQKNKQVRLQIGQKIDLRKRERLDVIIELSCLWWKSEFGAIDKTKSAIQELQAAMDEHLRADEAVIQIKSLFHRLQNGRSSLAGEKQLLREIKFAQEQKEKLCLNLEPQNWWMHKDLVEALKSKKLIKEHKEVLLQELQILRKRKKQYDSEAKQLRKTLEVVEKDIKSLQEETERLRQQNELLNKHSSKRKGMRTSMLWNEFKGNHPQQVS